MKEIRLRAENDEFQLVQALKQNRTKRQKSRSFFVEGVRNLTQAVAHDFEIVAFCSLAGGKLSTWAEEVIQRGRAERHYLLTPALMEKLSDKNEPSELVAVVRMPADELARIPTPPNARIVLLDRPSSPGNLGTLIRSCDAFGVSGVIVTGHAVDAYEPQVIRASMGSFFAVPVVRMQSQRELEPWLARLREEPDGLEIIGTSAKSSETVRSEAFARRSLLLFGNETHGLSAAYRDLCERVLTIPMTGTASSLNISCAASIVLYEAFLRSASGTKIA